MKFGKPWPKEWNLPFIDVRVEHIGVSRLRLLNVTGLKKLHATLVIRDGATPLAVIVPYARYIELQTMLERPEDAGGSE